MSDDQSLETEATELLRTLIRNACVNDGTPASGHEDRNCDAIEAYFAGSGLRCERYSAGPGRISLITRIEGSDKKAPTLLLMGHTDVVPANASGWERDPFGGEVVDGVVWGRGATDMLHITSTMAVAMRRLAKGGFTPRGTLIYLAVADEEAGGTYGAKYLTDEKFDAVKADYVITESGGVPIPTKSGVKLPVTVGEKGINWRRLVVRGTPGHGSMPFRTDNALVTAAEVVRRVAEYQPKARILDEWRRYVVRARAGSRARGGAGRSRPRAGGGAPPRAAGVRAPGACLHPHDVLPQRGAGRVEDQRHPRPHRHRRRRAGAARRRARSTSTRC